MCELHPNLQTRDKKLSISFQQTTVREAGYFVGQGFHKQLRVAFLLKRILTLNPVFSYYLREMVTILRYLSVSFLPYWCIYESYCFMLLSVI